MATSKPRVQVTLDQDVYDVIKSHASLTGSTMSGFISSAMEQAAPQLSALNKVLLMADQLSADAKAAFMAEWAAGSADLTALLKEYTPSDDAIARVAPAASDAPSDGSSPLSINKGVRFSDQGAIPAKNGSKNIYLASDSSKVKERGFK